MSDDAVSNDAFVAAVADTVAVLDQLGETYLGMNERHGFIPTESSTAMKELAVESRFAGRGWIEPVHEAQVACGMLSFAGVDHLRSYAHLFASPPIPVYSHLAVARASIEALAWCRWLADPTISVDTRVKRDRLYQLEDARQRERFAIPEMRSMGKTIRDRVRAGAPDDWVIIANDRNLSVGGEQLPTSRTVISDVLALGEVAGPSQLGGTLWSMLSGISHSARYALAMAMEVDPRSGSMGTPLRAATVTSSSTVHLIGTLLLRACLNGCGARFALLGWDGDSEWRRAVGRAEEHIHRVLAALPS